MKVKVKSLSRVRLFATPWTVAYQAPLSMGFSRSEYWSGLPFPSPGDLPDPGVKPMSPALQADALLSEPPFVGKVIFLLFNMLSRLIITFLPRSKGLLISWQRSPSIVILEPKKISLLHIHVNFSCLSLPVPLPLSLQFSDTVGVSFPISVLKVERKVKVKVKSLSRVQIL